MDAIPVLSILSVIFMTVSAALAIKLRDLKPQLTQAKLVIEMFSEYGAEGLKLLSNLLDVLDALTKAVEDGEISNDEATIILQKGKPLIEQGKEILNNPVFEKLGKLAMEYK
jgi:hypothetical protein